MVRRSSRVVLCLPRWVFIRVTFLVDRLPPTWKLLTNYFAHLVSLLFCLVVLVATASQALRGLKTTPS